MKRIAPLLAGAVLALALAACSAGSPPVPAGPTPTAPILNAPEPASTGDVATPDTGADIPVYSSYYNSEVDFSLAMPADWTAGQPQEIALGNKVLLGPDPTAETSSAVLVADPGASKQQVVKLLCGDCAPLPEMKDTDVNGTPASQVTIGESSGAPVDWFLLQKGGRLVAFSMHDPDTLETLEALVQSFRAGKIAADDPQFGAAAWAAQQAFAAEQGLNPYNALVKEVARVDWPDTCLGAPDEGEVCAAGITPGYRGIVQSGERASEFHANSDGSQVRLVPEAAIQLQAAVVASLKLAPDQVKILMSEPIDWPDSCLGLAKDGENCTLDLTPGYHVVLQVDGKRAEYRTDLSGKSYREDVQP